MSEDTGTMWANMLGLGGLMQTINDPAFHEQIRSFVAAIADTQQRVMRCEAKLDAILSRLDNDERTVTAALAQLGNDGAGTSPVAGVAVDDGTGQPPPTVGGAGTGVRTVRADRISGGVK